MTWKRVELLYLGWGLWTCVCSMWHAIVPTGHSRCSFTSVFCAVEGGKANLLYHSQPETSSHIIENKRGVKTSMTLRQSPQSMHAAELDPWETQLIHSLGWSQKKETKLSLITALRKKGCKTFSTSGISRWKTEACISRSCLPIVSRCEQDVAQATDSQRHYMPHS